MVRTSGAGGSVVLAPRTCCPSLPGVPQSRLLVVETFEQGDTLAPGQLCNDPLHDLALGPRGGEGASGRLTLKEPASVWLRLTQGRENRAENRRTWFVSLVAVGVLAVTSAYVGRHHAAFLGRCSIGFTDSRSPAAPRMAVRLRSSGLPDFESIR